jgi:clan AA aspartic protease (TIGR02281 family)
MTTCRRIVLGLVLAVASLLVALPALARRVEVPIEGAGKILIVEASINQRGTGRYIVDTGATYCVVSQDRAKELSIAGRKDGQKIRVATANGIIEATLGEARRIDVGDAVARDVAVAVMDSDPVPGFDGLLGLSFLQRFKYSVDSTERILKLEN